MKAHAWRNYWRQEISHSCRKNKQELIFLSQETKGFQFWAFWMPNINLTSSVTEFVCVSVCLQRRSWKQPHFLSFPVHAPRVCSQHILKLVYFFIFAFSFLTFKERPKGTRTEVLAVLRCRVKSGSLRQVFIILNRAVPVWNNPPLERSFKTIICSVKWDHRYKNSSFEVKIFNPQMHSIDLIYYECIW